MKVLIIKTSSFLLLISMLLLFSCKEKSQSNTLLVQAQNIVKADPTAALALLDSISNPEEMDKDSYMQYIVTHVQAKYKLKKEVTNDSLIFVAQKYFDNKGNPSQEALAHFYTGGVYYDRKMYDDALGDFMKAEYFARKAGDEELTAMAIQNVGDLYYEKEILDSAITCYRQSMKFFESDKGNVMHRDNVYSMMALAFYESVSLPGNIDSAYIYATKGLDLATKVDNQDDRAFFLHFLGIIYIKRGNIDKASDYLHNALPITLSLTDSVRAYLNLSRLHKLKNQPDSVKYYLELAQNRIPEVEYEYTLRYYYVSFANYYEQVGDYKEALEYRKELRKVERKIADSQKDQKLMYVQQKFRMAQREEEFGRQQTLTYLYIAICILAILILCLIGYFKIKNMRRKEQLERQQEQESLKLLKTENELLGTQNELLDLKLGGLLSMQGVYQNIVKKWSAIDKEVKALISQYGGTKRPEIFIQIEEMVEALKESTSHQLIGWAKDYLQKQPFGEKVAAVLDDDSIVFLVLCCGKYNKNDIASVLGVPVSKVFPRKLDIERQLKKTDLSDNEIRRILYPVDEKED